MSSTMVGKRRRGRPKKNIESNKLSDKATPKSENGKVVYSDEYPEFFQIYLPAMYSQTMKIPTDFIEKFGGDVPAVVRLMISPEGIAREVNVKRINNEHWCFEKGWSRFVEENSLQDTDFLTFSYSSENSTFFVKIFARNGCRKSFTSHHQSSGAFIIHDDDETIVPAAADTIPSFKKTLLKSHEHSGYIMIPMMFWREHMREQQGSAAVSLRVGSKSWDASLVVTKQRVRLCKGWIEFMKDNSLRIGDACTFQLTRSTPFVFHVTFDSV